MRSKVGETIQLQKQRKVSANRYEVVLKELRNRKAHAIIEPGSEYVKTFYAVEDSWFARHKTLQDVLKGNRSMSLKDMAHYHIDKTVNPT